MRPEETPDLAVARRTSPVGALLGILGVDQLRPLLPVVVIAASSGRFLVVSAVAVAIGLGYNVLSWWRRTWSFVDGVLQVDEGILVRNERRIPVERVQHVELERRLRHQAFGLSVVRIETAGGSGAELVLDAITTEEAEAVRAALTMRGAAASADRHDPDAEVLIRLPPSRLLLAGITGPEVAAVLAALALTVDLLTDLGVDPNSFDTVDATVLTASVIVLVGVPLWFLLAGIIGVIRRWDLTATVQGHDLRVTYGLLRRAEFTVDLERVQDVRLAHRLLLRPFGRADIRVRTAASGAGDHSRVEIPLLDASEIGRILARILPSALPLPELRPAPPSARRRSLIRGAGAGVLVGAIVAAASSRSLGLVALSTVPAATTAGLAWGEAAFRGLGVATTSGGAVVHSRSGAATRHHAIVPVERLQSAATRASWFQRRRALASVRLDLAGAHVMIADRADGEAVALVDATMTA